MKSSQKIFFIVTIVVTALIVGFILIFGIMDKVQKNTIPDTNGTEDFALNSITIEQIVSEEFAAYKYIAGGKGTGEQSQVKDYRFKDLDYTRMTSYAKSFSGIDTLHATRSQNDTLILEIESIVSSGNFAIIILVDGEMYSEVPINQSTQIKLTDVSGKTVLVRIAGESAEYEIAVNRRFEE